MNSFSLILQDATRSEIFDNVSVFVAEDDSGSFGIMASHARMMTSLVVGMARFRTVGGDWRYIAVPGGLVYFHDNTLYLSARHYLVDDDYERISSLLQQQLLAEEEALHAMKKSLNRLEDEALKRLWKVGRGEDY